MAEREEEQGWEAGEGEVLKARKLGRRLSNLEVEQNANDRSINGENEREKNNSTRALLTSPGLMLVLRPRLLRAGLDEPDGQARDRVLLAADSADGGRRRIRKRRRRR